MHTVIENEFLCYLVIGTHTHLNVYFQGIFPFSRLRERDVFTLFLNFLNGILTELLTGLPLVLIMR